jgi:beta-carotene 3-hydroxylase
MLGLQHQQYWVAGIGFSIALYGLAYFIVHEVIIHQRIKWFSRIAITVILKPFVGRIKCITSILAKEEGESFGMLYVSKKYWEKVKSRSIA